MSRSHSRSPIRSLVGLLVLLAITSEGYAQLPTGDKYALLVGVSTYESATLRELPFAERDVSTFAEVLKAQGYPSDNVILMTASSAVASKQPRYSPRAANVRKELKAFLKLPQKNDLVVLALAGHGVQFKDDGQHYFCPIDANLKERKNLISIADLYAELEKCQATVKLLFVDACRNDPFTQKIPRSVSDKVASKTRPTIPTPPGGVAVLFSCSKGQEAFESGELKHGVFFHFLLEGLRGEARNAERLVTVGSLTEYVSRRVPKYTYREMNGAVQEPDLLGRINPNVPLLDLRLAKQITNSVGMRLVRLPPGTFQMGSPMSEKHRFPDEVQHRVTLTESVFLGAHEVTQHQYQQVLNEQPSAFSARGESRDKVRGVKTDNFPVESVSWEEATLFCRRLSALPAERKAGRIYRLPTEAEWEYASRAGAETSRPFPFGTQLRAGQANCAGDYPQGERFGKAAERPVAVGSFAPNAFGLFDMQGNVWEWCSDWYDKDFYGRSRTKNPIGPPKSPNDQRVVRGGSWFDKGEMCRSAVRAQWRPDTRSDMIGFRVVCEVNER